MQGCDDGDGVRHAAESLRAARDALPDLAEQLDGAVRQRVDETSGAVEHAASASAGASAELRRELLGTAHEIRLIGTRMTAAREDAFTEVAHVLGEYADALDTLLRPADGAEPPVLSITPPPAPAPSIVTTAQDTALAQQHLPGVIAQRRAINQVVARFPPKLQELAKKLLFGQSSHAVERHGHHLRREHLTARVQWRLDPSGEDSWELNADGSVLSRRWNGEPHQVSTTGGRYTSPEAVAKPLIALLQAAGRTQADLDRYLDAKAKGKTRLKIFLRPADTGITPEDVSIVRAPGTDTDSGERMWKRTRQGAMDGHGEAPAVREHDAVRRGRHSGSMIMLVRRPHQPWRLVTSYYTDDPKHQMTYTEL
ncbi:hypothetical protein [Jiangella alkaliphila]|uniref:Uncharacterized protein n=1 Tax=Jiangella alkaliphila TaxID=419479 RepID=A0A1H2L6H2_9ACTN|nr:hypothetical protein [Jiangella alkaliphila]SDU76412.1 hypothetical protein SAMN04488563_5194 [Jiangella alkaliphila]